MMSWSDTHGGAASAALRLHRALREAGVQSRMCVDVHGGRDPEVCGPSSLAGKLSAKIAARWDQRRVVSYSSRKPVLFSPAVAPRYSWRRATAGHHDIAHLHWVCNGFLPITAVSKLGAPVVWTLHDQWPFTGGCHYSGECGRYMEACGRCPILGSDTKQDLSRDTWERKRRAWAGVDITLIAPSRWMARNAASSSLFSNQRVEVIPNCVDTDLFRPVDQRIARRELGLPTDRHVVLFAALSAGADRRKGFHLLQSALEALSAKLPAKSICLAVLGMSASRVSIPLPFQTHYLGLIHDQSRVALAYASADAFVAPSMEDNLPNTVMEALSCGVPCVAFDVGGMGDMIEDRSSGALVQPFEVGEFADAIGWVLNDSQRWEALSQHARASVLKRFAFGVIADKHLGVYTALSKVPRK